MNRDSSCHACQELRTCCIPAITDSMIHHARISRNMMAPMNGTTPFQVSEGMIAATVHSLTFPVGSHCVHYRTAVRWTP